MGWKGLTLDNIPFYLFCMKEPDYVMMLMSTYGTLKAMNNALTKRKWEDKDGREQNASFDYTEVIYNHYKYRHMVDDNNNNRMQPIAIETTWETKDWTN